CMKADIAPADCGDLTRIRALGSTGSPLSAEVQQWGTRFMARAGVDGERPDGIWWANISGGTDFAGAFLGGNRELPQIPGRLQCRMLGAAVEAWDAEGRPVVDAVGELVCTQPIPSMPLYLWGDDSGERYLSSYFDAFAPGHGRLPGGGDGPAEMGAVWRHGDWIEIGSAAQPGCVIYGRSDATLNRHGLRMGTSELYRAVEALPEVLDSLVVDLEYLGRDSFMPLFVVLRPGFVLDDALRARLAAAIRTALSPRFVPDAIVQVAQVPRTLSGKKQELPIKKLLLGQPVDKVLNRDAMANPECLEWYVAFAAEHAARIRS
ncbi:MAG: acetoacetate--CoA ligase, partial [Simplicispira sp.]|nr:acetoacetate--CoA ligase [Simplicispira sp.]